MISKNKNKKLNKGFTLIELLVVVLFIGILAGIALPQYQLARDKAEFTKYQSMVASLRESYNEYVLLHGTGTKEFSDLSFTMPSDFAASYKGYYFNCVSNSDMFCCMSDEKEDSHMSITCGKKEFAYQEVSFDFNLENVSKHSCYALSDNKRAINLCSSVSTNIDSFSLFFTPEGLKGGYTRYSMP